MRDYLRALKAAKNPETPLNPVKRTFRLIHPWSPGSVAPIPYRPGARDEDHEKYDRPVPIRELAFNHGKRWYRDACGDDNIPGKYGEIFRYGIGKLGVQIGGPHANNTKTDVPEGSNARINSILRSRRWPISQKGDGEVVFVVPEPEVRAAFEAIEAYRVRRTRAIKQFL